MKNEVNEIKISYCEKLGIIDSEPLNAPKEVAELLYQNWDKDTIGLHETLKVLLFNQGNRVKGVYQASTGGLTGTLVDLRLLVCRSPKKPKYVHNYRSEPPFGNR